MAAIRCHLSGLGTLTLSLPSAAGGGEASARGKPTGAMGVSDFLDKGPGGAQLPRKRFVLCGATVSPAPLTQRCHPQSPPSFLPIRQDRKDKEKDKRLKGQSSHAAWKSEAEMVLRQQYD